MASISSDIEGLFGQVASFESGSREFSARVFVKTLNGILSGFDILRDNLAASTEVDDVLFRKIRETDPGKSTLRFATVNLLGIYLEAEARGATGYLKSYQELVRSRSQNPMYDGEFIEDVLVRRLLVLRDLGNDVWLGKELLIRAAMFMEKALAPEPFPARAPGSELARRSVASLMLGFARRYLKTAGRALTEDATAIEYGLKREGFFEALAVRGRKESLDAEPYLHQLRLLQPLSGWARFVAWFRLALSKTGKAVRQMFGWMPHGEVFWAWLWMVFAIVMVIAVAVFWFLRYEKSLHEFRDAASRVNETTLSVKSEQAEASK
jgi:hypothetical protein